MNPVPNFKSGKAMTTVRELIEHNASRQPDKVFLVAPEAEQALTYGRLRELSLEITETLDQLGIEKGEKVAVLLPNGFWTTVLLLGIVYSGRVLVPLNAVSGDSALSYVLDHSDTRIIFINEQFMEKFSAVIQQLSNTIKLISTEVDTGPQWPKTTGSDREIPALNTEDHAILMYTSGTTGRPKGVLLSQGNVVEGGKNTSIAHDLTEADCGLCVLPLYHINAQMVTVIGPLYSGGSVVMPYRFGVTVFWKLLADYKCTWFSVVPTIIAYLLEQAEREGFDRAALGGLNDLRFGRSASAPLAPEMHKDFEKMFGVTIVETMGLTETAAQILSNPMPPEKPKYGSPGIAVGNEAKIIDEQGNECPRGTSGELMIRGKNVTGGYYKNPEATKEALEPDGWFHTGDIAYCDEDGFFFITGRIKELIIKGGENIAPREIDEALYEHPAVLEAAGFGIPDVKYGQEVMACVALKPGAQCSEKELNGLLEASLGQFKSPKRIYFMDELPKGPSGKIQRLKLPEIVEKQFG